MGGLEDEVGRAVEVADADACQAGMVTAETAAVLPVLALLLASGLWAVSAIGAEIHCADAAREAARAAARGEPAEQVGLAASRAAPPGARFRLTEGGGLVTATVTVRIGPLSGWLPPISVSGAASAALEPPAP